MVSVTQLQKPEQIRAAAMLQKAIPSVESLFTSAIDDRKMFPSNYHTFCDSVSKLPHGDSWLWNQSNAKVKINLPECDATMQKMNTRRKKNGPKAPFYKIWLFSIVWKDEREDMQFIWCERGVEIVENTSKVHIKVEKDLDALSPLPLSMKEQAVKVEPLWFPFHPEAQTHPTIPILTTTPKWSECITFDTIFKSNLFPNTSEWDLTADLLC